MSGHKLTGILSVMGTYDNVSGTVNFVFGLGSGDMMALKGNLLFDDAGFLNTNPITGDPNSSLAYTGLTNGPRIDVASASAFGFLKGQVCCSGPLAPNSFNKGSRGLHYMSLWGANILSRDFLRDGVYSDTKLGMDFRLEMSAVPIPAAAWLFGSALIGFIGFSRRIAV